MGIFQIELKCIECKKRSIVCTSALMTFLIILALSRNAVELQTV